MANDKSRRHDWGSHKHFMRAFVASVVVLIVLFLAAFFLFSLSDVRIMAPGERGYEWGYASTVERASGHGELSTVG